MTYYKFKEGELLYNTIKTYPSIKFNVYNGKVYYNNNTEISGAFTGSINCTPPGFISLYELNVDRKSNNLIYPFLTKAGSLTSFSTVSTSSFNSDFEYGDTITGSYPLSASISSDFHVQNRTSGSNRRVNALKNVLTNYLVLSPDYSYSSNLVSASWNKSTQPLRLVNIPSIFYGSSIKKGSVSLKYYTTGTLTGELRDDKKNGQLRQVLSSSNANSGSVAGVVLYNEGILILTGSWNLDSLNQILPNPSTEGATTLRKPRWYDFSLTGSAGGSLSNLTGSSFEMSLNGTQVVPTVTMFANANKGEVNYSNNPSSLSFDPLESSVINASGSNSYVEPSDIQIKNIVSASYSSPTPEFEKTVFINSVGIYDENKNLIAVAKMAKPIRKRNSDDLTFKLKLDF
jgi:hypothetical protein